MKVEKLSCIYANQISILYENELDQLYLLGTVYRNKKLASYINSVCEEGMESFFGIVENDQLLAVVQCKEVNTSFHINNIVVNALYQGMGFGKILLACVIEKASLNSLNVSLDVDAVNKKAVDWYLSMGFETNSESRSSIFKLESQTPSKINFHDEHNLANFGFSNIDLEDVDNIEFFYIAPNVFKLKNTMDVKTELFDKLQNSINGMLIIDSKLLSNEFISMSFYNKLVFRMVRNVV
tara:strand:- start:1447 stop:2160 length:714 start_codon:yes stop_codon:yes gene_type:complete